MLVKKSVSELSKLCNTQVMENQIEQLLNCFTDDVIKSLVNQTIPLKK